MAPLTEPVAIAGRTAPSRVVFGPHETNLGRGRALSDRHVAYYGTRAAGGAGVVVTEPASVHPSDWPYERAPLATSCGPGWEAIAERCRPHGTLVLGGIGHCGGQGSSAHSQAALWAPSRVADVVSRELPMAMERPELTALVDGFAQAASVAAVAGLDGVEVDAGPVSLLRQFHSGLTNLRDDEYGDDRLRLTREVLRAVREVVGESRVVALRLSCDELAPWAGVTPEAAADQVATLADLVDLLTVVRGGPYSTAAYRPDEHTAPGFNTDLCRAMRTAAAGRTAVVLQGSVVDAGAAQSAIEDGVCDLVEMTRAQIAEPRLVSLVAAGHAPRARPCLLCNQTCRVRDDRNLLVTCVGEPRSGFESSDPTVDDRSVSPAADAVDTPRRAALVVGAGVAGLECARVLSAGGHAVRVVERDAGPGGMARTAAVGDGRRRLRALADWLVAECRLQGVELQCGKETTAAEVDAALASDTAVVLATGSRAAPLAVPVDEATLVLDAPALLARGSEALPAGPFVVLDPVGGPIGVGVAEWLAASGAPVSLVTQDQVAGVQLARTGDLADANVRLQRAGVRRELRAVLRAVAEGAATLEDVWTGERRLVPCAVLVDCGHRLPDDDLASSGAPRAGDCVAPRTIAEAVREGRRLALEVAGVTAARSPALAGAGA